MNKINYQKELDRIIERNQRDGVTPSYCLEYLSEYFDITVYYYNPNISPESEYRFRLSEEERYISLRDFKNPVSITDSVYDPREFLDAVRGLEREPEGGKRCEKCFRLRLEASAKKAKELGMDCLTTTLTISPLKNAALLNEIGFELGEKYGVMWLPSDFKKREGYKRSIVLSREYDLYRQNYCGCAFSKINRE